MQSGHLEEFALNALHQLLIDHGALPSRRGTPRLPGEEQEVRHAAVRGVEAHRRPVSLAGLDFAGARRRSNSIDVGVGGESQKLRNRRERGS